MIDNLKDLKKLLQLCRAQGVTEIDVMGAKFKLGDLPVDHKEAPADEPDTDNPFANFPDVILTPEQLMYYSSGGTPENDPELKVEQ